MNAACTASWEFALTSFGHTPVSGIWGCWESLGRIQAEPLPLKGGPLAMFQFPEALVQSPDPEPRTVMGSGGASKRN